GVAALAWSDAAEFKAPEGVSTQHETVADPGILPQPLHGSAAGTDDKGIVAVPIQRKVIASLRLCPNEATVAPEPRNIRITLEQAALAPSGDAVAPIRSQSRGTRTAPRSSLVPLHG